MFGLKLGIWGLGFMSASLSTLITQNQMQKTMENEIRIGSIFRFRASSKISHSGWGGEAECRSLNTCQYITENRMETKTENEAETGDL